jgi:HSP20 family protein
MNTNKMETGPEINGWTSYLKVAHVKKGVKAFMNLYENDREYKLELYAPGLNRNSVRVDVEDGILLLQGKRDMIETEGFFSFPKHGFFHHAFSHTFQLPVDCMDDDIAILYDKDLLTLTIPRNAGLWEMEKRN